MTGAVPWRPAGRHRHAVPFWDSYFSGSAIRIREYVNWTLRAKAEVQQFWCGRFLFRAW